MKYHDHIWNGRTLRTVVRTLLMFLVFAGSASALSNSGGGSWSSSRDIAISNPGAALSDYQILVSLFGDAFPAGAKADGADVRFTNSVGTELAFWIEKWNSSAQKVKVWVNVRVCKNYFLRQFDFQTTQSNPY